MTTLVLCSTCYATPTWPCVCAEPYPSADVAQAFRRRLVASNPSLVLAAAGSDLPQPLPNPSHSPSARASFIAPDAPPPSFSPHRDARDAAIGAGDFFSHPLRLALLVALAASVVLFVGFVIASQFPDAEVVSVSPLEK